MEGIFLRSNRRHTVEELLSLIKLFLKGISHSQLSEEYGLRISNTAFRQYVQRYQECGPAGLISKRKNNHYSEDLKEKVVHDYLNGKGSYLDLAIKYNISNQSTVSVWVNRYTKGKENKTYSPKPEVYNMETRKTTLEERIKIMQNHLENKATCTETAEKFQLPYHTVYQWIKKYQAYGPDGLADGRGRGKSVSVQTDEEKVQAENRRLKVRNDWLEMENAVLKKHQEIERGLMFKKSNKKRPT